MFKLTKSKKVVKSKTLKIKTTIKRYSSPAEMEKDLGARYSGPEPKKSWKVFISQNEWLHKFAKLNPVQRCIYIDLLFYARNKKECYPSEKRIAKDLKINKDTVVQNLKILKRKHLIKIIKSFGKVSHYKIK